MGPIEVIGFERFINIVVGRGMVPQTNRDLLVGITIPIDLPPGLHFTGVRVGYHNQYLSAATNIKYDVPPKEKNSYFGICLENVISRFFELLFKKF